LRHHFRDVVRKYLKRDVAVRHRGHEIACEGFISRHTGLFQQRRVGGKARDPWLSGHVYDLSFVGAIGK
jgi:hypothetical protein